MTSNRISPVPGRCGFNSKKKYVEENQKSLDNIGFILYYEGEKRYMEFIVEFFCKDDGEAPTKDFILAQDVKMKAKLLRSLDLLRKHGKDLREPYSSHLSDDIFELRVIQGNNIARVLYFFMAGRKIILTHGFVKKSQKTPQSEIELAKRYMLEYKKRKDD